MAGLCKSDWLGIIPQQAVRPSHGVILLIPRHPSFFPLACLLIMLALLSGCGQEKAVYDPPRSYMPAADIYAQALGRMQANDWNGAIPLLNEGSGKGNAQAKYQLGLLYARGELVAKDMTKAREYLTDAAELGYAKAQYYLGHMYGTGDGVERSYQDAFVWFWLAASYGDTGAKRYMRVVLPKLTAKQYQDAERRMKQLWDRMPPESKKDIPASTSAMH